MRLFRIITKKKPTPAKAEISHISVSHNGADFRVSLKRSPKARRYTLRLRNATQDLVLSMPMRGSVRAATDFAERHSGWIFERMRKLPQNAPFAAGQIVPFRGVDHLIVQGAGLRGLTRSVLKDGVWYLEVFGEAGHIARRVSEFLRKAARQDLEAAVERYTNVLQIPARSVALKDTTTRWGSCSSRGALNFSWRLIMAPPHVLDYLAAHEVAHLKHMNHSDAFWTLTRQLCPGMDAAESWLKAHGAKLHRYGKSD